MSYSELIQLDAHGWELYNLDDDPRQTNDLADRERDRLITMIGMWYVEAGKHDVLPVDTRSTARFAMERPRMSVPRRPSGTVSPRAMARR